MRTITSRATCLAAFLSLPLSTLNQTHVQTYARTYAQTQGCDRRVWIADEAIGIVMPYMPPTGWE